MSQIERNAANAAVLRARARAGLSEPPPEQLVDENDGGDCIARNMHKLPG
jgi:hypothetical protein